MRRINFRILIGALLILCGVLMFFDRMGWLPGATRFFWAGLLAVGAGIFLYFFFTNPACWWAAIPGFTLVGMSASTVLPSDGWGGMAFLGSIGLGFWAIYLVRRDHWWAIIPGGVLISLGFTSVISSLYGAADSGGVLFIGLGFTFLLVALLAKMQWAYIPSGILLILGLLLPTPFVGVIDYLWIGVLVVIGVLLIINALLKRNRG